MVRYLFTVFIISGLSISCVFGYSAQDVEHANALAQNKIIVDQSSNLSAYRFDDPISRQEVVGLTMKAFGVDLPEKYICQGYYSDAYFPVGHNDIWVCRSVEMAADNGLVSRENTMFRPKDSITRAEALAIIMKAKDLVYPKNISSTSNTYPDGTPQWQIDLIEGAIEHGILVFEAGENPYNTFAPNTFATRSNVFEYAYNVIIKEDQEEMKISGTFTLTTNGKATYVNPKKDFEISVPDNYRLFEEEEEYDTYAQNVSLAQVGEDDIVLTNVLVGNEPCSVCDMTELEGMEEGMQFGDGTVKQKISDTLYIVDGQNEHSKTQTYIKFVFHAKTDKLYYAIATTTVDNWNTYKKELLTIVNSLKVYK